MDLGIAGRNALVCASSRGLGRACALELARAGANVVVNGLDGERLAQTARAIAQETGARVVAVVADVSSPEGREELLAALPHYDILVNNNGGPPSRDFREIGHDDLVAGLEANMIAPIQLIQAVIDGMVERRFGRIVNITSGSVKMPLAGLDLSSGARAGLTAFMAGVSRSVAHANVTINNLLPGAFETDRLRTTLGGMAQKQGKSYEAIADGRRQNVPAKRFGEPGEFGAICAFLCSAQAGYITGQNVLADGGAYPGTF